MDDESVQWPFAVGTAAESLGFDPGVRLIGSHPNVGWKYSYFSQGKLDEGRHGPRCRGSSGRSIQHIRHPSATNGFNEGRIKFSKSIHTEFYFNCSCNVNLKKEMN